LLLLVTKVNKKPLDCFLRRNDETIETKGFPLRGLPTGAIRNDKKIKNMWKLEPLNLAIRARNPDYYDKSRDMETALAYNAIKKVLQSEWREELFGYIKSVKLTDKNIMITTGKPIVNAELKIYREELLESVNQGLGGIGVMRREKIIAK